MAGHGRDPENPLLAVGPKTPEMSLADVLAALERRAYGRAKALLRTHFREDAAKLGKVLRGDAAPPPTPYPGASSR